MREGALDPRFALLMVAAGLPGVVVGARLILDVPGRQAELALGILTAGLGVYSWLQPQLGQMDAPRNRSGRGFWIGGLALFGIGVLNGSLTSGTGLFVTLWLVRWFGFDYKRAVAYTLILVGLFWNGTGAVTLGVLAEIRWAWLPALLAGSLLGGYVGAHLAIEKGNRWIKRGYELITLGVGLKLITG